MKHIILIPLIMAVLASAASRPDNQDKTEPVRLHIDVDRAVLPSDTTEKAIIKIGLDCIKRPRLEHRPPVNLALVIDRSGSMGGDKIAKAREASLELVRRLAPDDILSIVAYDSKVETLAAARRVGNGQGLEAVICAIEAGGNTALHGGVTRGADEIRRHVEDAGHVRRIILVSDGLANVGPSSAEELGRLAVSLVKDGISVTTIGLGLGYNEDLMTRMAQCSDGNTYFVENSSDLPRIFAAELGDTLNVVARRVVIEIDFPEGVRPLHFVGREGVIRGQQAELSLNQLYGGQEKFALIEVELAPSRPGTEREIARARLTYEDALNRRNTTATARRVVQFSADRRTVVSSASHQVQTDFAANSIAIAKDKAVSLVDAGRHEEAAAVLRQQSKELKSLAAQYDNKAVEASAETLAPQAASIAVKGLSNAERKAYRNDSTQTKNQQSSGGSPR